MQNKEKKNKYPCSKESMRKKDGKRKKEKKHSPHPKKIKKGRVMPKEFK